MSKHPGRRTDGEAAAIANVVITHIEPPDDVIEPVKLMFRRIVHDYPAKHFSPSDSYMLVAYCEAYLLLQQAQGHLMDPFNPPVFTTKEGIPRRSPWVDIAKAQSITMATLAQKLRICPSARAKNQLTGTEREKGKHGDQGPAPRPMFAR